MSAKSTSKNFPHRFFQLLGLQEYRSALGALPKSDAACGLPLAMFNWFLASLREFVYLEQEFQTLLFLKESGRDSRSSLELASTFHLEQRPSIWRRSLASLGTNFFVKSNVSSTIDSNRSLLTNAQRVQMPIEERYSLLQMQFAEQSFEISANCLTEDSPTGSDTSKAIFDLCQTSLQDFISIRLQQIWFYRVIAFTFNPTIANSTQAHEAKIFQQAVTLFKQINIFFESSVFIDQLDELAQQMFCHVQLLMKVAEIIVGLYSNDYPSVAFCLAEAKALFNSWVRHYPFEVCVYAMNVIPDELLSHFANHDSFSISPTSGKRVSRVVSSSFVNSFDQVAASDGIPLSDSRLSSQRSASATFFQRLSPWSWQFNDSSKGPTTSFHVDDLDASSSVQDLLEQRVRLFSKQLAHAQKHWKHSNLPLITLAQARARDKKLPPGAVGKVAKSRLVHAVTVNMALLDRLASKAALYFFQRSGRCSDALYLTRPVLQEWVLLQVVHDRLSSLVQVDRFSNCYASFHILGTHQSSSLVDGGTASGALAKLSSNLDLGVCCSKVQFPSALEHKELLECSIPLLYSALQLAGFLDTDSFSKSVSLGRTTLGGFGGAPDTLKFERDSHTVRFTDPSLQATFVCCALAPLEAVYLVSVLYHGPQQFARLRDVAALRASNKRKHLASHDTKEQLHGTELQSEPLPQNSILKLPSDDFHPQLTRKTAFVTNRGIELGVNCAWEFLIVLRQHLLLDKVWQFLAL